MTAKHYLLTVNKVVLFEGEASAVDALSLLFGVFYVLNLEYPQDASLTLEFIQRYVLYMYIFLYMGIGYFSYLHVSSHVYRRVVRPD